jgi:hypothetical protein
VHLYIFWVTLKKKTSSISLHLGQVGKYFMNFISLRLMVISVGSSFAVLANILIIFSPASFNTKFEKVLYHKPPVNMALNRGANESRLCRLVITLESFINT